MLSEEKKLSISRYPSEASRKQKIIWVCAFISTVVTFELIFLLLLWVYPHFLLSKGLVNFLGGVNFLSYAMFLGMNQILAYSSFRGEMERRKLGLIGEI